MQVDLKRHILKTLTYRFFATLRWFSLSNVDEYKLYKNDTTYDWSQNKIFIEKYEKMYLNSIITLIKKKVFTKSKIIFCMDSPKENLWRTKLKPNYKGDRIDLSLKNNFKPTFNYTYEHIIPKIINEYNNISKLRVDKLEADDLIGIITMHFEETNPKQDIIIVSGDNDFLQLGRENVNFINYKKKKLFSLTKEHASTELNNKIILGDSSDCIPSIFPKGKRIKKKDILESDEKLQEYLNSNINIKNQYELNKKLIDFKYIPPLYREQVIKLYLQL
jgi:5'-3' exonuclease